MTSSNLIDEKLAGIRDRARVQAHLLSMDAHDVWRSLERELTVLEEQLTKSGGAILTTAAEKAAELVERAEAFLEHQVTGELTLASPARHAMSAGALACSASDTANVAAQIMWEQDCGAVPVVDAAQRLVGMLTDRDLAMACYTQGKAPAEVAVAGAMSSSIYSVRPDDSLADVIALMKLHKVRRVPVSNEAGHLLGVVSVSDVLRRLGEQRHGSPLQLAVMQALTMISAKARH